MKKIFVYLSMMAIAATLSLNLTSCGDDDPPVPSQPTVAFLADIDPDDGYMVNLTVQSTDATTFAWDYGDGNTSNESGNHSYTYAASGDYTITVKATGEGGSTTDSETISIAASFEEMLAGADDTGKTWILTQVDGAGKMGVGHVDNSLGLLQDVIPANVLEVFGLGDEYGDEFTFFKDGKFTTDHKNGKALASALYGGILIQMGETDVTMSTDVNSLPLSSVPMENVTDGTWSLSYEGFSTMAQNEYTIDPADQVLEEKAFTFTEDEARMNLKLSTGAYVGFFDLTYPVIPGILDAAVDNSFYIIKDVKPDEINIAIASCGLSDILIYPTYMLHLTLIPKQ